MHLENKIRGEFQGTPLCGGVGTIPDRNGSYSLSTSLDDISLGHSATMVLLWSFTSTCTHASISWGRGWGGERGVGRGHSTSHEGILSVYLLNRVAALASLQVAQCSSLFFMKLQVSLNK